MLAEDLFWTVEVTAITTTLAGGVQRVAASAFLDGNGPV